MNSSRGRTVAVTAAAVTALAGSLVIGEIVRAPSEPARGAGWVREPADGRAPARAGKDPSRGTVEAELAAAATAAGIAPGAASPAGEGDLADCLAHWSGNGPADDGRLAALESALVERGWRVAARKGEPAPAVALESGSWHLEFTNGGLLQNLSLTATRSGPACDRAFRRDAATRAPHG
ncbi:hypothetical protein ACIRBY_15015 [Streptomyces sp. NPDC096136]|uniref:hypothetical protein n=1 Tax=Streptomyces sp. NPDC096136 TaxID=3366076 RepID=UPI003801FA30